MHSRTQTSLGSRRRFALAAGTALAGATLAGAALPLSGLLAGPASALPNPACTTTAGRTTCTFSPTGGVIDWPVPAGITSLNVTAYGGSGGTGYPAVAAGGGGEFHATLTRIPAGTTLGVFPGQAGGDATDSARGAGGSGGNSAGSGGGGAGGNVGAPSNGGGGGGASSIFDSPDPLVSAGGGGGAGGAVSGSGTGGNGAGSGAVNALAGQGGAGSDSSATVPGISGGLAADTGAAGASSTSCAASADAATPGSSWQGGAGASPTGASVPCMNGAGGGGGGGGLAGGGGGGNGLTTGGGGGGGSAFPAGLTPVTTDGIKVTPVADASTWTSGNGQVVIEYSEASTRLRARFTETRHGFTVSATLTAGGYALAGQDITFVTDPYGGSHVTLCTAATNSRGIASCHLTGSQERAFKRAWGAFTARYAGDPPDYKGSSARDHGVFS
jgi:hypothetical protein